MTVAVGVTVITIVAVASQLDKAVDDDVVVDAAVYKHEHALERRE